jgi:hypothetical protein
MRLTMAAGAAIAVALAVAPSAVAHHGDTGEYDITRPLFVRGEVLEAEYGFPHATMRVRVAADQQVPGDLSRYRALEDLDEAPSLDDLATPDPGEVDLLLHPTITSDTLDPDSGRPEVGDTLEGIFLRRCPQGNQYDGEIRAVALSLGGNGVSLRPDGDPTGYSEGCGEESERISAEEPAEETGPPAASADDGGSTSPVVWAGVAVLAIGVLTVLGMSITGRVRQR